MMLQLSNSNFQSKKWNLKFELSSLHSVFNAFAFLIHNIFVFIFSSEWILNPIVGPMASNEEEKKSICVSFIVKPLKMKITASKAFSVDRMNNANKNRIIQIAFSTVVYCKLITIVIYIHINGTDNIHFIFDISYPYPILGIQNVHYSLTTTILRTLLRHA